MVNPSWKKRYAEYFAGTPTQEEEKTKKLYDKLHESFRKAEFIDKQGFHGNGAYSITSQFEGLEGTYEFRSFKEHDKVPGSIHLKREFTNNKGEEAYERIEIYSTGKATYTSFDSSRIAFKSVTENTGDFASESLFEGESPLVKHIAAVVNPLCEAIDKQPQPQEVS